MEQRLTFITIGVDDLHAMRTFYEEKFGWKTMGDNEGVAFFKLNGIILALFGKKDLAHDANISAEGSGFKPFALAHNLWSEKDVDDFFTSMRAKGVRVVKDPEKVFWGGYSGYIADIEDNLWEIAYNPFLKVDEDGNVLSM